MPISELQFDEEGFIVPWPTKDARCRLCGRLIHWNVSNEPEEEVCGCRNHSMAWREDEMTMCPKRALLVMDEVRL
jgi:hypothetical protein